MKHLVLPDERIRRLPFYLAMEEWAAHRMPPGEYFFAWRTKPTVICGRHQEIDKEVNLDFCRAHGIDVCRRRSGGGCVYADMNNWMFSYVTPSDEVTTTFAGYTTMIASMLATLGFDVAATGRNDLFINGRKVAGNAFYHLPGRSIVHGTMLYDIDTSTMSRAITPGKAKLESKGVKSVASHVTCLKDEGMALSVEEFGKYAVEHLTDGSPIVLTEAQIAEIEEIEKGYYEPSFLAGHFRDMPSEKSRALIRKRRIEGVGDFSVAIVLDAERHISSVGISGDYFITGDLEREIISRLKGVKYEADAIGNALATIDPDSVITGLSRQQLISLLI